MSTKDDLLLQQLPAEIATARQRISNITRCTELRQSLFYSQLTGANVYLKCENLQATGSFKLRGAANKFLSLTDAQRRLVVAASTGNHGKAVATVASQFGSECKIFAPVDAKSSKLDAIRRIGAEVVVVGDDCLQSEQEARNFSAEHAATYLSPYNDPDVVAGQGTIGLELCEQLQKIDAVFASVGGGGMLGGLAAAIKPQIPDCEFIACSPENSCVMVRSMEAGRLLDLPSEETLSDGTAGGLELDSITFGLCEQLITRSVLVSESEIAAALRQFIDAHSMLIEGAAAVAIAGLLQQPGAYRDKNVVIVLCGGNIGTDTLAKILVDRN